MDFEEIFGKSVFIEHLTEAQQTELFNIIQKNYLLKQKVKKAIQDFISTPNIMINPEVHSRAFTKLLKELKIK